MKQKCPAMESNSIQTTLTASTCAGRSLPLLRNRSPPRPQRAAGGTIIAAVGTPMRGAGNARTTARESFRAARRETPAGPVEETRRSTPPPHVPLFHVSPGLAYTMSVLNVTSNPIFFGQGGSLSLEATSGNEEGGGGRIGYERGNIPPGHSSSPPVTFYCEIVCIDSYCFLFFLV